MKSSRNPKSQQGKPWQKKVRVPWADHVLNGRQRRTAAKHMKLASPEKAK